MPRVEAVALFWICDSGGLVALSYGVAFGVSVSSDP